MRRSRGFTLIELLVVIAIIGILAAMLFPVFARARESARKTQCLANVKNTAIAFNMYLTDYDKLPPKETRAEVLDLFCGDVNQATGKNPYLRIPVILDDYVKNRQVWQCPSAKITNGARSIIGGDWFRKWVDGGATPDCACGSSGSYCDGFAGNDTFPPGWGGDVTDSILQGQTGLDRTTSSNGTTGAFVQSVGVISQYYLGMSPSSIGTGDAANVVVTGDAGTRIQWMKLADLAYPDVCKPEADHGDCTSDWVNCDWSRTCGLDDAAQFRFWTDPNFRKQYTRHLGGSNLGFLDGHAKWMPAEAIYANCQGGTHYVGSDTDKKETDGALRGVACCDGCYCKVMP